MLPSNRMWRNHAVEGLRMQAVEWMNKALFNLGFDEGWGWLDLTAKNMIISREKKIRIIEKGREIQKLIYSIKFKIM